jgi:hypothetical protein
MITPKNNENNDAKNDVTIVGTDFFTDSESFLNELTDDELEQVRGGGGKGSQLSLTLCDGAGKVSNASLLLCK